MFAGARSAHLATADAEGRPHIVPVTFVCEEDRVYIAIDAKPKRSQDLKRLRNIRENPNVAIMADEYDDDWSRLWWVRGDGVARIVTGEEGEGDGEGDGRERGRDGMMEMLQGRYRQYVVDVPQGPVIEVTVSRWSGWAYAFQSERQE